MAKLRHIAIACKDPDAMADFYCKAFDFKLVSSNDGTLAYGHHISDGTIDPTSVVPFSGREQIDLRGGGSELDFSSVPGAAADGVDFVPSTDPIYVDLRVDGAPASIYFTGADTSRLYLSDLNPVAFTSP